MEGQARAARDAGSSPWPAPALIGWCRVPLAGPPQILHGTSTCAAPARAILRQVLLQLELVSLVASSSRLHSVRNFSYRAPFNPLSASVTVYDWILPRTGQQRSCRAKAEFAMF